jgi:hypothetical protein
MPREHVAAGRVSARCLARTWPERRPIVTRSGGDWRAQVAAGRRKGHWYAPDRARLRVRRSQVMSRSLVVSILLLLAFVSGRAHADAPLVRGGNGAVVGFATGVFENGGIVVLSLTGYRFVLWRGTGWLRGVVDASNEVVYYDNPGCLGTAYLPRDANQYRGVIVPIRDEGNFSVLATYYTAHDAIPVAVTLSGRGQSGANGGLTCAPVAPFSVNALPLLPNNPAVTGVAGSNIPGPITITRVDVFRNGFESTAVDVGALPALA